VPDLVNSVFKASLRSSSAFLPEWFAQVTPGLTPIHGWLFSSRVLPQSKRALDTSLVVTQAQRTQSISGTSTPKKRFYWKCRNCDFTKFIGTVHSITYHMSGVQNWRRFWVENDLYRVREKVKGVGRSSCYVPRFGLDRPHLLSKLLLREEPECGWIQNRP